MSSWIPRSEHYYNEHVPQDVTHALGREVTSFSSDAYTGQDPFPPSAAWMDEWSDTLYVIPRLDTVADYMREYYKNVVQQQEESKP